MQEILTFIQHHEMLSLALSIVLTILILLEFIKQKSGSLRVSPAQATQLINRENAIVVDVRSSDAFASGHVNEAISLPLSNLKTSLQKIEKYKEQPIILVCALGNESQQAAPFLQKNGFKTYILNNGLRSWKTEQLPLIKT